MLNENEQSQRRWNCTFYFPKQHKPETLRILASLIGRAETASRSLKTD